MESTEVKRHAHDDDDDEGEHHERDEANQNLVTQLHLSSCFIYLLFFFCVVKYYLRRSMKMRPLRPHLL